MSYRSNDYSCPEHGRFEQIVPREEDDKPQPCPECEAPSPWVFPAPMGRMAMGGISFERGRSDGPRHRKDLDTRALADGSQTLKQFRAQRRAMWARERHATIKQALS